MVPKLFFLSLFFFFLPQIAFSQTFTVPADYPTVQSAVDNASDGDVVLVADGTYLETVGIHKSIVLKSLNGAANTSIQQINVETSSVVVQGFSIRSMMVPGSPANVVTHLTIKNNRIEVSWISYMNHSVVIGNQFVSDEELALSLNASNNNRIIGNTMSNYDYGIWLFGSPDNTITNNTITSIGERAIWIDQGVTGNFVANNTFADIGNCLDPNVVFPAYPNTFESNLYDWNLLDSGLCPTLPLNVAIHKTVVMSSSAFSRTGSEAVDGSNNDFTCTDYELEPFWIVDLSDMYDISRVSLTNRLDCCQERLRNFFIEVSDDGSTWQQVVYQEAAVGDSIEFPLNGISGRYLRVRLDHSDYLSLTEVSVLGRRVSE
jgi:parallel beta-helix repeat protein